MSSPMTATSGDAPTLTVGTTADPSPSPVSLAASPSVSVISLRGDSESLTPPPDVAPKAKATKAKAAPKSRAKATPKATPKAAAKGTPKATPAGKKATPAKRKADDAADAPSAKKKSKAGDKADGDEDRPEKGTYCHQCRTKCEPECVLRCTRLRKYTKNAPARACNLAWCERDLAKRYEIVPDAVRLRGHDVSAAELALHDADKAYVFSCPCCIDECQNATCRVKKGLPRLGDVVKLAGEQGITPLELVRKLDAEGPPPAKAGDDSDLTDIDAPKAKAAPKKKKAAATAKKSGKADTKAKTPTKGKAKEAAKKDAKKGKTKEVKKEKEAKKVVKKEPQEVPVDPPVFHLVNAKLSYDEIEHRLYLREFVNRFRSLLGVPDRSIAHLDDFDHAIGEASMRQVAGGMLDLIVQDEGRSTGLDADTLEMISDKREELRHYADLARFAQVYKEIAEPLGLKMLPAESVNDRNNRAVRALLNLGDDEVAPSWALESGPSRRAAASRLPSSSEVARMLIAISDYIIYLDALRSTMDPSIGNTYHEHVKKNMQYNREENARWEAEKKAIMAARVRCKSAEQMKASKARYETENAEHNMRLRAGQVMLNIVAARKQTKFAPLGTDPDGRIYYALTPRLVDEERYRPSGWTRGVMVWGPGVDAHAAEDDLPTRVPRWSYFSTAADARQLHKWLDWRVRGAVRNAEAEEATRAKDAKKTPKKANGAATATTTPNGKATPRLVSDGPRRKSDDDGWDAESELSDAPETTEDLLALLDPPGYMPGADKAREGVALVAAVEQVAALLEVLEWKGYA